MSVKIEEVHNARIFSRHSKGEAVAAQSEKAGIAIAGGFDAVEKLMGRMGAAVMMAFGIVLMLRHRHTRSRRFANVQWCAVTAEHLHRRPFRQHGERGGRM